MGIINVLDISVANLIAAGEVVDRPASVIKELTENAIDAGATSLSIEIQRGGVSFMRVTDNGCGMSAEDVPVALLRHATSKIKNASDLDGIMTLGFRGEALAAISSVSSMRIMTKQRGMKMGTILEAEAGEIKLIDETGCADGTTVIVEDLFANVPARRKFLKRDITEAQAVGAVCEKLALSRPDISIKFISDGNIKFSTAGDNKLINAITGVLGRDFSSKLTPVHGLSDSVEVYGYIGTPENIRGSRNSQNFFINGRYIKTQTCCAALEQAFDSFIPSDKYPVCILNVKIHPSFVDVNVHPTKLEVKFSNDRPVFDAVYCAIRNALLQKLDCPELLVRRDNGNEEGERLKNAFIPVNDKNDDSPKIPYRPVISTPDIIPGKSAAILDITADETEDEIKEEIKYEPPVPYPRFTTETVIAYKGGEEEEEPPRNEQNTAAAEEAIPEYKIIGEVFNSFVMVELKDTALIIDKHAAHERILFEQMKENMKKSASTSQLLLAPVLIPLSAEEYAASVEYGEEITSLGFDFEYSGEKALCLTAIPGEIDSAQAEEMICEILVRLSEGRGSAGLTKEQFYEKALYQASCKAAIKAGRIYDSGHIKWIVKTLLTRPEIRYCPHGRPVAFEMTHSELEKRFKRT